MKTLTPEIIATPNTDERYHSLMQPRFKDSSRATAVMMEMLIQRMFNKFALGLYEFESVRWFLMELSNGGFYYYPADKKVVTLKYGKSLVTLDNHQLGIAITLDVLTSVSIRSRDPAFKDALEKLELYFDALNRKDQAEGVRAYMRWRPFGE